MPEKILMPSLGETIREGTLIEWLKRDREQVKKGDILFTIESDKALTDIEAVKNGILHISPNGPLPGDIVSVGTVLGYIYSSVDKIAKSNVKKNSEKGSAIEMSDIFEKKETKVNRTVNQRLRKTIAKRMYKSTQSTAPVTITSEIDSTEILEYRKQLKRERKPGINVPTFLDIVIKLVGDCLEDVIELNSIWKDGYVCVEDKINIGFAVDTVDGLLVPVIHDVASKSIDQIITERSLLIKKSKNGKFLASDLTGGTFTISNLGMFQIDSFTPIINFPEAAILGMGRTIQKPVVVKNKIVIRHMTVLSLTWDHRIADGVPAAKFLTTLGRKIEKFQGL